MGTLSNLQRQAVSGGMAAGSEFGNLGRERRRRLWVLVGQSHSESSRKGRLPEMGSGWDEQEINRQSSTGQRSTHQNRVDGAGPPVLECKEYSVMDRGKEMLLGDRSIEEVPILKLRDHRSCGQRVGLS